jgi:hypothetical protein
VIERVRGREAKGLRLGVAFVAVLAYAYWFTDRRPFTEGASLALLVPIVVLVAIAEVRRVRRRRARIPDEQPTARASRFRSAIAVWSALATAVLVWEILALRSSPRSQHPTISSLVESIERYHVGRIALFFAWLWLGWTLAS